MYAMQVARKGNSSSDGRSYRLQAENANAGKGSSRLLKHVPFQRFGIEVERSIARLFESHRTKGSTRRYPLFEMRMM